MQCGIKTQFTLRQLPRMFAYNIELALNRNETGLSATNTTSWVSTNAPQVLLYACLIEAFKFLKGPYDLLAQYEKKLSRSFVQRLANEQQGREEEMISRWCYSFTFAFTKPIGDKNGNITGSL